MKTRIGTVGRAAGAILAILLAAQTAVAQDAKVLESMGLTPLPDRPASLDFELENPATGEKTKLSSLRGKFVLLNFWATWCLPCLEELPSLQSLHARTQAAKGNLVILAVSSGESRATVVDFLAKNPHQIRVVADYDGAVSKKYGVQALPTTYLIDPRGRVLAGKVGAFDWVAPAFTQGLARLK